MAVSGSAIRAGRAFVELFADTSPMIRGLKSAEKEFKAWGASITRIGASIAGVGVSMLSAFGSAAAVFASVGGDLDDMSQRTGVAVEQLSTLGYAAKMSGASLETVEGGLKGMQKQLAAAAGGSETASKAFTDLGLSVDELMQMTPDEQFRAIAEGISKIDDPAKRAQAATEALGKSGRDLLPMMLQGAKGIRELEQRAAELGGRMSGEDAQSAAALGDAWDDLLFVGKNLAVQIGAALAPTLTEVLNMIVKTAAAVVKWVSENRELILTVAKIAVGITAAGAAIAAIGTGIVAIGAVFGGLTTIIAGIGAGLGVVMSVMGAMLTPLGLLVAGLTVAGGAWMMFTESGQSAMAYIQELLSGLWGDATATWQGISDALAAGDLEAAANIAWLGIKKVWLEGTNSLEATWLDWKVSFLDTFGEAVAGVRIMFTELAANLHSQWVGLLAEMGKAWISFYQLTGKLDESSANMARKMIDVGASASQSGIASQSQSDQSKIAADAFKASGDRQQAMEDALAASASALEQATQEWEASLSAAASKRTGMPAAPTFTPPPELDGFGSPSGGGGKALGTFSAAAAGRLGGNRSIDKIAKYTEQTAKNTANLKNGQPMVYGS